MHSQFEASEKHFNKTNKDVTINENLTLIRLGFLRVVFSGGRESIWAPPSYFKKNLSNINITLYNC